MLPCVRQLRFVPTALDDGTDARRNVPNPRRQRE